MEDRPLTYIEKLENVYILLETRNMLEHKLKHVYDIEQLREINADLETLNQDILSYAGDELPIDAIEDTMTKSLFNPAVYFDDFTENEEG